MLTSYKPVNQSEKDLDPSRARAKIASAILTKGSEYMTQRCQTAPAMTDEWRVEAGLTVRETSRTRAGAPTSRPVGVVDTRQRRQHTITWTDEATPHTRAKPAGVRGCEIWVAIDDQPPTSKHQMTFLALDTASPYLNVFEDGTQFGKIAHYMLRWVNSRNEPGPWSETVSATIGA